MYTLVNNAPTSFPTLFIHSLVEVHKSNAKFHGIFFPVFIHRILLDLGLEDFPAFEPVHIITPIGATFIRQTATQMKASSKRHRVESSTGDASRPPSSGDPSAKEFVNPTTAVYPPPSSSSDSSIRSMLDTVMTIQAAHGQILLDVLTELQALLADLAGAQQSSPLPPFDDKS